jgi:ribosomal protein L30/L7E
VTDIRAKLEALITDSGTYRQGQQDERQRLRSLIDVRIDQLRGICGIRNREQMCAELLQLRQLIDP